MILSQKLIAHMFNLITEFKPIKELKSGTCFLVMAGLHERGFECVSFVCICIYSCFLVFFFFFNLKLSF